MHVILLSTPYLPCKPPPPQARLPISLCKVLVANTQPFFLNLGNKIIFCFLIKKTFHNRFPYISLYQLNIFFFILRENIRKLM
jgi:hypothetical protein